MLKGCINCIEIGGLNECLGYKSDVNNNELKIIQLLLEKSLRDKFNLEDITSRNVLTKASKVLVYNKENKISEKGIKYYRRKVGKLLCITRFSQQEIVNAIKELSNFITKGTSPVYLQAMLKN